MSSSASTILRQELMAAGENDGTWGPKINTNLQIIEAAIADTVSLSLSSSDATLTNADYTNDQSKKAIIYCSGTLSANVNVIVPNKSKTFWVVNNTSGAYTVKVKTSGGTGITITQGQAGLVWCDGSDVLRYLAPMCVFVTGAPGSSTGAAASAVSVTPSGNLASTDAQSAFVELQTAIDASQPLDADLTAIAALTPTKGNIIAGTGSAWAALGVGTNGYVLTADSAQTNGTKWSSVMPASTNVVMQQTSAPDGYTKQTTHTDKAMRVTSGTASSGGSSAFSTVFASQTFTGTIGGTAISTAQTTSHNHSGSTSNCSGIVSGSAIQNPGSGGLNSSAQTLTISANGSGSTHNHSLTMDAFNLAVQYVDVCIHQKN